MKNTHKITLGSLAIALSFSSCCHSNKSLLKGHKILPFANQTYKVGQVVEEYSSPEKIVITIDPSYKKSDIIEGNGADVSADVWSKYEAELTAKVNKLFSTELKGSSESSYVASYINTRVRTIPKGKLFKHLKGHLATHKDDAELLRLQQKEGIHHSTVTSLVVADIMITKKNEHELSATISDLELKKLNANVGATLTKSGRSTYITKGANLPVAMYTTPNLVKKVSPYFIAKPSWRNLWRKPKSTK